MTTLEGELSSMIDLMIGQGMSRREATEAADLAKHAVDQALAKLFSIGETASNQRVETAMLALSFEVIRVFTTQRLDGALALLRLTKGSQ